MIRSIAKVAFKALGRRKTYRIGRAMYMWARGDIANNMRTNGEMLVQRSALAGLKRSAGNKRKLVVFDVGANIGEWSAALISRVMMLEIGDQVELYAFEPVPATREQLARNLAGIHPSLFVEEFALSSSNGTAEILISGDKSGTNSLNFDLMSSARPTTTVNLITATDFCEARGIERINLLKCDTEGHDMEVIRGAMSMLREERIDVFQFEYNHRWVYSRNFLHDVFQAIDSLPYVFAKLQSDHLMIFDKWHPEMDRFFEANYLLIHEEILSSFPTVYCKFDDNNAVSN